MFVMISPYLGIAGIVLAAIAYFPQIRHLIKEKCAACIDLRTWAIWVVASILIMAHALAGDDLVFQVFSLISVVLILVTLVLATKYKGNTCETVHFKKQEEQDKNML